MSPELLEDLRAARYRAMRNYCDAVQTVTAELERDRDAYIGILELWMDGSREMLHQADKLFWQGKREMEES